MRRENGPIDYASGRLAWYIPLLSIILSWFRGSGGSPNAFFPSLSLSLSCGHDIDSASAGSHKSGLGFMGI